MRARFLMLWTVVVFATALSFVVHLTVRSENVRLGYTLAEARSEQERLLGQRRLLSLESATLRQFDRVETVARGAFGMQVAEASRVIAVDNVMTARISGRAQ